MTALFSLILLLFPTQPVKEHHEKLLVFLQEEDQYFTKQVLPRLQQYAKDQQIMLDVKGIDSGLPPELTSTPALVFVNTRGRAVYAGRYAAFSTIENFIRSSRVAPQLQADHCRENILSARRGRMQIVAPLKITELKGTKLPPVEIDAFEQALKAGIEQGAKGFSTQVKSCLERTDRAFYLDVHPYLDKNEQLYLSYAVFSQFDCITPIATSEDTPITGAWAARNDLYVLLGQQFETIVSGTLATDTRGDALTAIPSKTKDVLWDFFYQSSEIGLVEEKAIDVTQLGPLPKRWRFAGPIAPDFPVIQFQFQAPLDRYAGEVTAVTGSLAQGADETTYSGQFTVQTGSLTMGMPGLDQKVHKKYIKIHRFPEAAFQFSELKLNSPLQWGIVNRASIKGHFQLMRFKKPITIAAEFRPIPDEEGKPILLVSARFQLNITDDFGIAGPDGPKEAAKMMHFNLNFLMR